MNSETAKKIIESLNETETAELTTELQVLATSLNMRLVPVGSNGLDIEKVKGWENLDKLALVAEILGVDLSDHTTSDDTLHELYDDMLNESYDAPSVANCQQDPSAFLKSQDPTAYDCGYKDWLDNETSDDNFVAVEDDEYVAASDMSNYKDAVCEAVDELY